MERNVSRSLTPPHLLPTVGSSTVDPHQSIPSHENLLHDGEICYSEPFILLIAGEEALADGPRSCSDWDAEADKFVMPRASSSNSIHQYIILI